VVLGQLGSWAHDSPDSSATAQHTTPAVRPDTAAANQAVAPSSELHIAAEACAGMRAFARRSLRFGSRQLRILLYLDRYEQLGDEQLLWRVAPRRARRGSAFACVGARGRG